MNFVEYFGIVWRVIAYSLTYDLPYLAPVMTLVYAPHL